MSGLTTSQISFSVYGELYAPRAAEVQLKGVGYLPKYYIANRSMSNGVTQVTCYDRMAFADKAFPYSEYTADVIPAFEVLQKIADVCGVPICKGVPSWITSFNISKLQGTCADIMTEIAETACGFWRVSSIDGSYEFVPFGSESPEMSVEKHTALNIGNSYSVQGIHATDATGNVFTRGAMELESFAGIIINSDLITDEGVTEIWDRANGYNMYQISCEKAIVSGVPEINTMVNFAQGHSYVINNISCSISAGGIIATLQGNAPSGDETGTRGIISRKLSSTPKIGKQTGSHIITPYQGIIRVSEGAYEEEEGSEDLQGENV